MVKYIISAILLVFTILFGFLKSVWAGFTYFALVFGAALALLWTILLIYNYIVTYSNKNLQERYKIYCAVLVNSSALTLDIIHSKDKIYFKKFKRTLIKEKAIEWIKIMLALGLFITMFVVFI